jgi:orotate phosphoribosyltransferase-like protein
MTLSPNIVKAARKLRKKHGMKHNDISDVLGISPRSVQRICQEAHLTNHQESRIDGRTVAAIRRRIAAGMRTNHICEVIGVSQDTVNRVRCMG